MSVHEHIVSHNETETETLGRELAGRLEGGSVVLLIGELGAGKSVFARGVAKGFGVTKWKGSPTFTLINEYDTQPRLYHSDLYRLTEEDVDAIGLDELVSDDSVVLVEWPERALAYLEDLGRHVVTVRLHEIEADRREIRIDLADAAGVA